MLPQLVNITAITGQRAQGKLTAWQTPNGNLNVEHLAGRGLKGECLVFYWSPAHDWQVVNVTQKTGAILAGDLTSWQSKVGGFNVEHLAGRSPNGDLLVFAWSPAHDWQVVNVSQKTGYKIAGEVVSWQTPNGAVNVEHLGGRTPNGELIVFYWSTQHDWQAVNVTTKTGVSVTSDLASYVTPDGPNLVEHLAGQAANGHFYVFWWSAAHDWQALDITAITGRTVAGSPSAWLASNIAHLGVLGANGSFLVFWWTSASNWQAIDASAISAEKIAGTVTPYQRPDGTELVELAGARSPAGALLLQWWKPSRDWQAINLSEAVGGLVIAADPVAWLTPSGATVVEHLAAPTADGTVFLVYMDGEPRHVIDVVGGPFHELLRTRNVRRKLAVILWDPHRPEDPAPLKAAVDSLVFGPTNSVRDYYLQNSNGYYTIEKAALLGWYDALKPASHYWGPIDTNDTDGDGWVHPHVEKWAEAIRRAGIDLNFKPFDNQPADGGLSPDELGILMVIPQNDPFGTNRGTVGREYPNPQPLVVDGVRFGTIAEVYIGNPPNLGVVAHELEHLFLHGPDMYFTFPEPYAAGMYSLMDGTYQGTHIDPFQKLKFGWLRPRVILKAGHYQLADVETHHEVWILVNPHRTLDEYFIIENRWPGTSYDKPLLDQGLAVWHIMENPAVYGNLPPPPGVPADKWAEVAPNEWGRRGVRMLRPVPGPAIDDKRALYDGSDPETGYDLLSADPNPAHTVLRWADGTPSGFAVRGISAAGATMSATITVPF